MGKFNNENLHRIQSIINTKNKCIDSKTARNNLVEKQEFNLQLFNRLYNNKLNIQYSFHKLLRLDNIYVDIQMILNNEYNDDKLNTTNTIEICEQSYPKKIIV